MIREHSKAYKDFIKQISAEPRIRYDGYDDDLLKSIYPEEREEIESLIIKLFEEGDYLLSFFIPKIRRVNGVELLTNALAKSRIPSGRSITIAGVLYQQTENNIYLDTIVENLNSNRPSDRNNAISTLSMLKPNERIYNVLKQACINDSDEIVRTSAALGILYCKGYIKDPFGLEALNSNVIGLYSRLDNDDVSIRIQAVQELE